jgi:hypothetical protein
MSPRPIYTTVQIRASDLDHKDVVMLPVAGLGPLRYTAWAIRNLHRAGTAEPDLPKDVLVIMEAAELGVVVVDLVRWANHAGRGVQVEDQRLIVDSLELVAVQQRVRPDPT